MKQSGQILDATLATASRQRNANGTEAKLWRDRIPEGWKDKPAKLADKNRHARRTLQFAKVKRHDDETLLSADLAIPFFGYQSYVSIDLRFRLPRKWETTAAAASYAARLCEGLLDSSNTESVVLADTAYRSKANDTFMEKQDFVSKTHRQKPHIKLIFWHIQRSNAPKSVIRSSVEDVFAAQKSQMGRLICTAGIDRTTMKTGLDASRVVHRILPDTGSGYQDDSVLSYLNVVVSTHD